MANSPNSGAGLQSKPATLPTDLSVTIVKMQKPFLTLAPSSANMWHYAVLCLAICGGLWFAWTGYVASDDAFYAVSGAGWAYQFPYVAHEFAGARTVIVAPIGLAIRLFGNNEFSVVFICEII